MSVQSPATIRVGSSEELACAILNIKRRKVQEGGKEKDPCVQLNFNGAVSLAVRKKLQAEGRQVIQGKPGQSPMMSSPGIMVHNSVSTPNLPSADTSVEEADDFLHQYGGWSFTLCFPMGAFEMQETL